MSADVAFVLGLLCAGLAGLNLLARRVDGHPPWSAAVLGAAALALVIYAELTSGWAYGPADVPIAVVRVVAALLG